MSAAVVPVSVHAAPAAHEPPAPSDARLHAAGVADVCVTCGQPAGAAFCPHCGERRASDHAYTLHALAADVWDHVTPADGRTVRSLWTLVRHPGALTVAYMRGVRRPYLAPLGVFLFVNTAYFVYVGVTHQRIFNTPLQLQLTSQPYSALATRLVTARLAARHVSYAVYASRYDAVTDTQSRTLIAAMVPGFALLVALVSVRRRRGALHHLAFSFHALAMLLVVVMGFTLLVGFPVAYVAAALHRRAEWAGSDVIVSSIFALLFGAWLAVGLRRAYGDGRVAATFKAILLASGVLLLLGGYRLLLFFTTFWAT